MLPPGLLPARLCKPCGRALPPCQLNCVEKNAAINYASCSGASAVAPSAVATSAMAQRICVCMFAFDTASFTNCNAQWGGAMTGGEGGEKVVNHKDCVSVQMFGVLSKHIPHHGRATPHHTTPLTVRRNTSLTVAAFDAASESTAAVAAACAPSNDIRPA